MTVELDVVPVELRASSRFVKPFALCAEVPVELSALSRLASDVVETVLELVVDGVLPRYDSEIV